MGDHFDHPGHYTHGHGEATLASHAARTAANSAAYLLPHLQPGMRLLDIGCGPGTITLDLAQVVAPGEVVGVDSAETALTAARDEAARRGDTTTRFDLGDVASLPFEEDSFDVVHAHQVLHHLADPVAALREMRRVCRPGGWIAVRDADYSGMAWYPPTPGLEVWRRLFSEVQRAHGAEPDAARRHRRWVREAGLAEPRITTSTWTYADPESCSWWADGQATRYGAATFTDQAREIGASEEDLEAVVQGWRSWGADPDAWFVMVHGELLAQG